MRSRQKLIHSFYTSWKVKNPDQKLYNIDLRDYINIRYISIEETAAHASLSYLSTLAVLQLDAILVNSRIIKKVSSKHNNKNHFQSFFPIWKIIYNEMRYPVLAGTQ